MIGYRGEGTDGTVYLAMTLLLLLFGKKTLRTAIAAIGSDSHFLLACW